MSDAKRLSTVFMWSIVRRSKVWAVDERGHRPAVISRSNGDERLYRIAREAQLREAMPSTHVFGRLRVIQAEDGASVSPLY